MKISRSLAVVGVGLVALSTIIMAHHSTNDVYDQSRTVEISGKVVAWRFVNPHPFLVIEVTKDGRTEKWDLSFGGSAVAPLRRQGYTTETFKVGEVINARGNPALSNTVRGILIRGGLTRQDGSRIP